MRSSDRETLAHPSPLMSAGAALLAGHFPKACQSKRHKSNFHFIPSGLALLSGTQQLPPEQMYSSLVHRVARAKSRTPIPITGSREGRTLAAFVLPPSSTLHISHQRAKAAHTSLVPSTSSTLHWRELKSLEGDHGRMVRPSSTSRAFQAFNVYE